MMDIHMFTEAYCDTHFMMCLSQNMMLYTLHLNRAVCQLYRNKLEEKTTLRSLTILYILPLKKKKCMERDNRS